MSDLSESLKGRFEERYGSLGDFGTSIKIPTVPQNNDSDSIGTAMYHGLLGAAGNLIHTANDAMVRAGKPKQYTDEEWFEKQTPLSKAISQFGRDLEEEHKRNYTPWSANRVASGVAGVAPYAVGLGLTGAAMARTGNYKAMADSAYQIASKIGLNPKAAEITSKALPAITYGSAMKAPESLLEGQGAYDDFIEESKRNGTYIKGQTEQQASELADKVTRDNLALLMGSGSLEEYLLASRPGGSFAKSAIKKILGGSAINAGEEAAQQIIPKSESGKDWHFNDEDVLESALIGAIAGGGMQAAGVGMNAFPLRNESLEQAQAIINQQNQVQAQPAQTPIDTEHTAQPAMSVQEAQSRMSQPAPTISAENSLDGFDSRYVSKWESKPGATDLAGVQQSVKNAFNAAIAEYGDGVTLTGGAEKGYHATGAEGHEGGWKIDVDKASVKDPQKFLQAMARHGFKVGDEGDHYDLSGHAKGGVGGTVVATPDSFISNGGQSSQGTGRREGHANAWAIYDVFKNAGYSDEAIAGILGRAQQEHNFSTDMAEEKDVEGIGRVGGFGMFQWQMDPEYGGRGNAFMQWAQENNLDPNNATVQAQYALIEAQQRGLTPERMNKLTAEEAADLWTDEWEVGKRGNERQYAAEWRERIKNGGSTGGSTDIDIPSAKVDTSEEDRAFDEYNKQLDELAEKGIEAPFKTEQPTQKELVQQAKEAAIDAGDMDEVQRINSAERSGNKEELAKIADKALKAKQKEVKGKPAPATPEIKMATPNLIGKVRNLLQKAKEQGVKLEDTRLENTLKDGSEETLQNFATMLQGRINESGYESRVAQGKQLLDYADEKQIDLQPGLRKMLREGQPKAIEAGQTIIDNAMVERRKQKKAIAPTSQDNKISSTPQQNTAVLSKLSDEVIGTIKQYPDLRHFPINLLTPEEQEIVKEAGLVHDNDETDDDLPWVWSEPILQEGDRRFEEMRKKRAESENASYPVPAQSVQNEQAPAQEPKQAEPAPAAETAPADEDYHGFFDDKKPGAVREGKKRLEEKINPFGNAEGFRTVKSIMERWAEADESNQSNTKGRSYYVHGNKVSKAAYDYYNHMFKNSEKEVQAEPAPKQESAKAQAASTEGNYSELKKSERENVDKSGDKSAESQESADNGKHNTFTDLQKAVKANGRKALLNALDAGYKPVEGENAIESPDGVRYYLSKEATDTFKKDYEAKQGKQESPKQENKLQRMRRGREELEAVAKKYEDGEITQSEAYSQVSKIAKDIATVPKDGVPNATFIDGKMKQELNDYGDRLIDEAFEAAEKSAASKSKFKEISDILSKYEKGEKNLIPIEDLMKQVHSLKTLSKEQMQALDERAAKIAEKDSKEVVENEQQGESGSPAGGHEGVRAGESEGNQRGMAGEVSGRDGREGTQTNGSGEEENATGLGQPDGVREGTGLEETASAGTDKRGNQPTVPLTEAEAHPSPTEIPGNDYEIKDTDQSTKSEKVRFKQNVDAIKMLKQLEEDDRMPTPAEQEILGAYNGWGGLKNAFLDGNEMNKELRDLLTDDEYKAAQSTINDAFYTPPKIIRAIWEGVSHLGFKGGRVLDPSMGVGNFFGTMPRDMMEKSALRGVELDNLTSRFAKMLYPSAFVENKGFQKASVADNYFDLAISNIPFGQNMINGYQVHNYFFANGIDKVRPGGLMVYITSQGSLAGGKDAAKMRNYLENQADLIAAYKLPSGVFSDAGTQVATDIVIFRKRDKDGKKSPYGQKFGDVKEVKVGQGYYAPSYGINEYFVAHKENILGEQSTGRDQWGNTALNVKMAEGTTVADVADDLRNAMQKLPDDVYQPVSRKKSKSFDTAAAQKKVAANERTRDYEYYYKDGKPVQNQNGQEVALTGKKAKVVDDYLKVKNTLNALFAAESDPKAKAKDVEGLRKKLNKDYDSFVAKHGLLTGTAAKNYADDPSAGMVQALEKPVKGGKKGEVEKADIFTTRSIKAVQEVSHVETADDALIASLTNHGTVDLDYMAELTNSKPETLISKLKGKLFKNPTTGEYETRDEYLSGNVREKLAQAKEAAKSDKSYADNVKELEKVIPEDLVSDEIFVNLGTPWIPVQDVQAFVDTLADNVHVSFSRGAALWTVTGWGRSAKYKLRGIEFPSLLSHVLNNKAIQIYDGSGDDKVFNQEKTDAANVAAEELQQDFKDWIWKDKDREKRLVKYYNDNYNNTVVRQYDGQHLNLHAYGMNAKIELKPHQKDVVWRMLQGGNTLIAHCVGAGKTFEMQAAGMEMRRLGIANKPMYCLPNNVVQQFAREFRQLYPNAKLLVLQSNDLPAVEKTSRVEKTEDGRTKRVSLLEGKTEEQKAAIMAKRTARNRMLNRIRTEDWDGIIISHNLFQRFPVNPETAAEFIQQEIDTLEQTIREAKQDRMDSRALSNLETSKKNLQERLEEVISTDIDDIGVPFEELGIDQLFVDEADMFKNLAFATRLGNIRGLSNSKANRSQDMFLKTQWLTNNMGGRGVVFATGTPVSNTMSELYTMMRYLDMKGLKEKGLEVFDNWMRTFGDIGQGIERKPTGDGFRKVTMIKRFINMAELTKMFRSFADVKVQDELNLDIPKLKNDKTTVVALEPDEKVVNYIKNVVPERVKKMKNGFKKEKGEDNMLSLTNDLRKLSLTDSKIEACADAIAKKYHDTADVKGTQLVFCDMGIPKAESEKASGEGTATTFDVESPEVYRTLIAKLKEKGIPDKDIAFIQNYNTKTKRDEVFQKVNNGEIRILIGSTETMGAGTNCQTHLVALHDLDAPWRPRDLEQRHGRILRQGNENKEVEIFNYVVKDSFDANMWEKLKNKAAIIQQAMSGDMNMRTVEDADLVTLSYAEVEGAATGNSLIKEQLQVQNDLTKYQHAQTAFRKKIRDAENTLAGSEESIAEQERVIAKIEKDIAQRKDTKGEKFSMLINGKGYKDRDKANEALANILKNYKQQKSMEIGQIGGFRLTALYSPDGGLRLQLVNNRAYEVKTHSVAGIENTLRNGPEKSLEYRQSDLDAYKQNVAQAQEIVQQENPYAEKVKQLSDRLNQLNREIADTLVDDGKNKVAQAEDTSIDSEPETEVKEPAKEETPVVKETLTTEQEVKETAPAGKSTANVNVDEFKHTKTGKMIPAASLKDHVDKDFRKQATTIAKNHGGKWSPFAKRILFKTEQGRDDFVREIEALLSVTNGEAKTSAEGEIRRAVERAVPVANEDLTPQQRKMSEFGKEMGTPIMWISTDPKLHGFHAPNGTTVLNVRSNMDLSKTFWHEAFHWVAGNNEGLYNELLDYFKGKSAFSKKQLEAYRKRIGRPGISDELTIEEMLADYFEEVKDRVKIFKEMGAEQPSLARKFVAWVKRIMDKFAEFFHNPEGKLTTAQRDSFVKAFGRLARDMKDGNGRPLFKVYKEGKEIRLTNGRLVTEGIKLSAEKGIDNSDTIKYDEAKDIGEEHKNFILNRINQFLDEAIAKRRNEGRTDAQIAKELQLTSSDLMDEVLKPFSEAYSNAVAKHANKADFVKVHTQGLNIDMKNGVDDTYDTILRNAERMIEYARTVYRQTAYDNREGSAGLRTRYATWNELERAKERHAKELRAAAEKTLNTTKHSEKGAFSNGETKYSYGPSNNSNKGFLNCIRNVFSKDELAPGEEWRTRKRLTEMLEKALQVKIKPGDVSKGVYPLDGFGHGKVIFKESDKVIKSQNAYDFENILPLSGAIIAEKLGMVDKWTKAPEETRNYIAKWIVTGAPNDTSAVAKDFAKAMQGNQILATRLEALQDEFMKWEQMSYDEKMKRLISFDNRQKVKLKDRMNRLYEEFVEELAPVDRLVKAINAKRNAAGKKDLGELADPYVAFRLLRGSYGNTITMIEGIGDDAVKALREKFPNLKWENFKTMRDILESIGGYQNTEVQKDFVTYCIAHHVLDMHNRNAEIENSKAELMQKKQTLLDEIDDYTKRKKKLDASHWLSESERAEVKLLDKNIEGNKKRVAELEDKLEKLKLLKTPKEYSRENCERYIKDYDKKYGEKFRTAQQDMVNFSNTTAEMLYDSGVIGYKRYQELMNSWPNYVPMFRVFDENEDIDFGDSMEHIEGSTRDIVNPLESIIRNTALFVKKAETNKARQLLANIARCDSSAYLLEEKDAKDNEEKTITFYENGQKKYLVTDPDIVRAVNNFMLPGNTSAWVQLFHSITSIARAAFTTVNPEFFLRNPIRDIADAMLYTKYGYTISLKDFVNGLMHAIRRDDVYYEWLTQGAGQASVVALDRDYTKSILEKMSRTTKEQFRKNFLSALVDSVQKLSEYSELGTRIATYKHAKRAVLKDKPNATIEEIHEAMVAAALESRDLMDFARHGKAGAEWNKYVAFSNASIQGLDKLYRQIRNPKTRGKTMAKLAIYAVLPALVLFMLNKDDDEYKQAESWLKETHWLIPMGDTFLRIPKAADVGVRFLSNWVEKNLEAAYYGKEHEWTEYAKPLYDALPDITWTALAPMLEMKHNYDDFTQRNIVPQKEQHLPAYLQYGERQTRASKLLGELLYKIAPDDMKKYTSPRMIEHFIVGYGGTMGMVPFKAWDLISGEKSQSLSIEELPVIRGFLWKAYKSPESVNDFYKEYNKQLTFENEFKMTHQKPEGFDPAKLKRLKQAQKMMQKIKKQEKTIIDSDKWSIEDKEVMQRNIQKKRIEIAKRALGQK